MNAVHVGLVSRQTDPSKATATVNLATSLGRAPA